VAEERVERSDQPQHACTLVHGDPPQILAIWGCVTSRVSRSGDASKLRLDADRIAPLMQPLTTVNRSPTYRSRTLAGVMSSRRRMVQGYELSDEAFDELAAETIARPPLDPRQDPDDGHTN
jgi:hypothetical protein